uniref:Aquaporin n=1 Tax=Helix pomatia TaxID=6536 RepID=A0A1I7PJA3_HELPO|nr:aquaporin [Helix pomatia]
MIDILGFHEIRTGKFVKAVLAEFVATAILIIAGCGSCVTMDEGKPLSTLTTSLTFGMTVAFIVYTFNHVSGAHINPVVTMGFLITGHTKVVKTIAYTVAQCGGAIAGSAVIWYLVPPGWRGTIGSTVFAEGVTLGQGFVIEATSTCFLMLGVLASADNHRTDHGGSTSLTIGLVVFTQSAWAGKPTGCSMNPARSLGPAVLSGTWANHWVYWAAPAFGSILGSLFYHHVLAESPPEVSTSIQGTPLTDVSHREAEKRQHLTERTPVIDKNHSKRYQKQGFSNPAMDLVSS